MLSSSGRQGRLSLAKTTERRRPEKNTSEPQAVFIRTARSAPCGEVSARPVEADKTVRLDNRGGASYAGGHIEMKFNEQSDEELLLACRRGDGAAWEALVSRFQRLIYAVARRAGLDEDLSAEVFQEVFITLFEKLDSIEQPERLHAWLVTTARRKTWRVIRREGGGGAARVGAVDDEEREAEIQRVPDQMPLPDEVLMQLEEQHRVRTALAALDERCRKLLTMLFYSAEPPTYAQIAAATGTPEGSIGPTRARCLQKLMRALEN